MLSRDIVVSIPVEIWHQCWELTQRTELEVLSRTCHFFRDICLPLLFANLTHEFTAYNAYGLYWELSSVTMLLSSMKIKQLAASSKLSTLPRRWRITDIGSFKTVPAVFDDTYKLADIGRELYLESVSQGLSAFTGLRAIEIGGIRIGEDILNALNKLPALESLACLWTKFSCYSITPLLQVREFTISGAEGPTNTPFDIVSSNFLERLTLTYLVLPSFLKNFSSQGPYQYLSDLSLGGESLDIQTLFNFLWLCPQLKCLVVDTQLTSGSGYITDTVGSDIPSLPTSAIPRLQSFSGRGYLASAIIPGRPVEVISIKRCQWIDTQGIINILKSISQSTVPVRGLHLPSLRADPAIITFIRKHFPCLKLLRLTLDTRLQDIQIREAATQDDVDGDSEISPYTYTVRT